MGYGTDDDDLDAKRATYPGARLLVGLRFTTGDGEQGRVLEQVDLYNFLIEWDDGRITLCSTAEMHSKGEPDLDAAGKRTGKWLRAPGWNFSRGS